MNRIDALIRDPLYYYDSDAVEGWVLFCENELTLTDGSDVKLLWTFKLWGEQVFGWYYFVEKVIPEEDAFGNVREVKKTVKKRLTLKQFLIIARGGAKTMYDAFIQAFYIAADTTTTKQITTAPTMRQADEVMSPIRTAIVRARGPVFKVMTMGSINNTTGSKLNRPQLCSTKKGIQNFLTNSILEIYPMSRDRLQGARPRVVTVDEWLSGDIKEDVIGAIEQGASKLDDYIIICTSSEGTVRNGPGDSIKMELMNILTGKYRAPHISIWYYRLDDLDEVNKPRLWRKANPNLGYTVSYEAYQQEKERAEHEPATRNDFLAKRFGIPSEGLTYFFTYEETLASNVKRDYWQMPCALGADLSLGDDFCAFTFLFPLHREQFGVKTRCYISSATYDKLSPAMREKYQEFIREGSLIVLEGTILDMNDVYDDLDRFIQNQEYDVRCLGYDPYNAKFFLQRYEQDNGPFGVEKVIQGARTESVPLGELKKLARDKLLVFDQMLMQFCMGNCITIEDTNGNRKLYKRRNDEKIDAVAAMMDAFVSYKVNKDIFE
jgi:phage terminase large subunit-like protein